MQNMFNPPGEARSYIWLESLILIGNQVLDFHEFLQICTSFLLILSGLKLSLGALSCALCN